MDLQQILDYIPNASTVELTTLLNAVQNELPKREGNIDKYVEFVDNFCDDTDLLELVWAECESLNLSSKRTKTASQWLSSTNTDYVYPDSNPVHKAKDIKSFPNISKLLSIVNESTEVSGPLDSCLILKYNSDSSSLSLHADGEECIDQEKSICSFSLGSERTLEFYENASGKKPKRVKSIRMTNNSLVIM